MWSPTTTTANWRARRRPTGAQWGVSSALMWAATNHQCTTRPLCILCIPRQPVYIQIISDGGTTVIRKSPTRRNLWISGNSIRKYPEMVVLAILIRLLLLRMKEGRQRFRRITDPPRIVTGCRAKTIYSLILDGVVTSCSIQKKICLSIICSKLILLRYIFPYLRNLTTVCDTTLSFVMSCMS